ncbi:hypothetical protein GGF46_002675 [Coemansia sp. RSA 552]|nr:hypothetical protein GGF46_002675 [Coemansia sp. RSA 552]
MERLVEYLVGVIESSYEDLEHLVPCGSFLGLFDERPIKRARYRAVPGGGTATTLFEFDNSEATCSAITRLALEAIDTEGVPAVEAVRAVVDAVRSIHDASAVLDIGFRSLFEIYQKRLDYHSANRYRSETPMASARGPAADGEEKAGVTFAEGAAAERIETFGQEYLLLTRLFELHRPRTWVAAVRLVSMVTKSAIQIMYGGTGSGDDAPSLSAGTHAASLSEISGLNLLPEHVCRETIRQVWRLLLDSAADEPVRASVLGSARRTRWQIRFEATMELFDCFVGRSEQWLGRPLVSYYVISRELDPGAAVAESGMLTGEMQQIVDLCFGRKRRLGRILLPPDGSWPLISHASRAHTDKHVYDQPGYALVRDSLTREEAERGASANRYVADLLYQRAPIDEVFAAIRNHRSLKRQAMAAVANESYVPRTVRGRESESPRLGEETDEQREASALVLEAMVQRIEHVVRFIQQQSDFSTLLDTQQLNENSDKTMVVPRSIDSWQLMNEVADQLYYFVLSDTIAYTDIHTRLFRLVFPADGGVPIGETGRRDNSYIWLLLQLLHIEKVAQGPVRRDLLGDEDMLDQLLQMYNERQIVSRDAFYLRDLALQATMNHQQPNIRDNQGVKFRHPRMAVAMPFAPVVYSLQQEFGAQFKDGRHDLLEGRTLCAAMKTATVSQIRQYVVPNALYTFLVPATESVSRLQGAATTYLQGGRVATALLDHINVGGKHRLLQLVYKMMLAHEQGPQFQFDGRQPSARPGITCVSPHVVDTVYRLLYNAPYSNELMMKEVLEKLRRCDKAMALGGARFSPANLRWLYTVYQLMNCRLLRFFKYYAHASHLVHHLRHSLVQVRHRQLYGSLECFALCLVNLQHDVGFLEALLNPAYHGVPLTPHPTGAAAAAAAARYCKPKDAWFECSMLSRNAFMVIARITLMRGLGDVPASLVDFIVGCDADSGLQAPSPATRHLLNEFMFTYRLVHHEHVVFALTRGEHDLRTDPLRLAMTRFVLLESPGFVERLEEWHRLDFRGRYWADHAHWEKQETYLSKFPEFFEYEAYLVSTQQSLDPSPALSLPVYYENSMVRLLPVLEYALGRMIEAEDRTLLCDVLDRMGILYRLHQVPLTTLMNTLFIYYDAPTLHDARTVRSLNLALLDMSQQDFSREFEDFIHARVEDHSHVDASHISRAMDRIARAIMRHIGSPAKDKNLPEIHYREIPNPILLVLTETVVELLTWWCLYNAPTSAQRLHDPASEKTPVPSTEPEFRAEEQARRERVAKWPLARLWIDMAMDPATAEGRRYTGATYIHATSLLANVLPDELLAFPVIQRLSPIVLDEPVLKTISGPKRYFSFVEFSRRASLGSTAASTGAAATQFAATSVFNSFELNRSNGTSNRANTYLTLLHSVLHYGGIATFRILSDTIHKLASDSSLLCSDIQLLYLCATVGPVLYRLVDHEQLYVQVLADLVSVLAQICPRITVLDINTSTDAIEQVMDFFCFVKDQFDPGRAAWRRIAPHIAALPPLLRHRLQCVVDQ